MTYGALWFSVCRSISFCVCAGRGKRVDSSEELVQEGKALRIKKTEFTAFNVYGSVHRNNILIYIQETQRYTVYFI